jgi:hypothetical protein
LRGLAAFSGDAPVLEPVRDGLREPDGQRVRREALRLVEPVQDVALRREEREPHVGLQHAAPVRHALPVVAGLAAADAALVGHVVAVAADEFAAA